MVCLVLGPHASAAAGMAGSGFFVFNKRGVLHHACAVGPLRGRGVLVTLISVRQTDRVLLRNHTSYHKLAPNGTRFRLGEAPLRTAASVLSLTLSGRVVEALR